MRPLRARLQDILDAARDLETFTSTLDEAAFASLPELDRRSYRAIKDALSDLGEAVKHLPEDLRHRHPGIDWKGFAALRDVLAHQYFQLEMRLLWRTLEGEVPSLRRAVETELERCEKA